MIQGNDQNFKRKPEGPRKVRNGIRLRSKDENPEFPWPAAPWFAAIMHGISPEDQLQGLEFARKGQTKSLEIEPGRIVAKVQDIEAKAHVIHIEMPPIGRSDWDRIVNTMAKEARYAAKLVTGDIPPEIAEPFAVLGLKLFPDPGDVICTSTSGKLHSHHAATIAYLLAERMEDDALMILTLRGLFGPRFIERLQEARLLATSGVSRAHPVPSAASVARDLPGSEERLEEFWTGGNALLEFERASKSTHAPHALLRRLGTTPLEARFPLVGLLASIYDSVTEDTNDEIKKIDEMEADTLPPPSDLILDHADPYSS